MMILSFSSSAEIASNSGQCCPGVERGTWEAFSEAQRWLLRAIRVVQGRPHASLQSDGYPLY